MYLNYVIKAVNAYENVYIYLLFLLRATLETRGKVKETSCYVMTSM